MCGIFGFLTNKRENYADDFLSDAFVTSMLRGTDSSGIASISLSDATYFLHKLPVNGLHFKGDKVAKRYMGYGTTAETLSMCHVRAATVGDVSISNSHPFIAEHEGSTLIGTHNGTLTSWKHLASAKGYEVDSDWALNEIKRKGIDAFKDISGAYAFVWWDGADDQVLHMARNKERPLFIAFLESGGMAYASEAGMLYWLLERNAIKMVGSILSLDVDKHYKFPVDDVQNFTTEALPVKEYNYTGANYGRYGTNTTTTYQTTVDKVKGVISRAAGVTKLEVTSLAAHPAEVKLAQDYGWYGERAVFTQLEVDSVGDTVGIAETSSTEFDAVIRGDMTAKFDPEQEWLCTVVGVKEDGQDMTLILSEPYRTLIIAHED